MNGLPQPPNTTDIPTEEDAVLSRWLLLTAVLGTTLPWLGLLLVNVLQANLLDGAANSYWLPMIGYLCWAVSIALWTLVLTLVIRYLIMRRKTKALSSQMAHHDGSGQPPLSDAPEHSRSA